MPPPGIEPDTLWLEIGGSTNRPLAQLIIPVLHSMCRFKDKMAFSSDYFKQWKKNNVCEMKVFTIFIKRLSGVLAQNFRARYLTFIQNRAGANRAGAKKVDPSFNSLLVKDSISNLKDTVTIPSTDIWGATQNSQKIKSHRYKSPQSKQRDESNVTPRAWVW